MGSRRKVPTPSFPLTTSSTNSDDQDGGWEVEEILKKRKTRFGPPKLREGDDFLIKWKGYAKPTWEYQSSLFQCDEKLREFYDKVGQPFVPIEPSRTLEKEFETLSGSESVTGRYAGEGVSKMNQISCELGLVDPRATNSITNNPIGNLFTVGKVSTESKPKYNLRPTKNRIGLPLISEETNTVLPEPVLVPNSLAEGILGSPIGSSSPDRPEGVPIAPGPLRWLIVKPCIMRNRPGERRLISLQLPPMKSTSTSLRLPLKWMKF